MQWLGASSRYLLFNDLHCRGADGGGLAASAAAAAAAADRVLQDGRMLRDTAGQQGLAPLGVGASPGLAVAAAPLLGSDIAAATPQMMSLQSDLGSDAQHTLLSRGNVSELAAAALRSPLAAALLVCHPRWHWMCCQSPICGSGIHLLEPASSYLCCCLTVKPFSCICRDMRVHWCTTFSA